MHDDLWVALDFETATSEATSACALGIAVIEGLSVVETRSWLVRPPMNDYAWYCTRVHGITAEDTEDELEFDEVWEDIAPYVVGRQLLAHNAPFDSRVLSALAQRHELDLGGASFACTVAMARKAFPHLPDHKLPTVCSACGVDLMHHDAASDAIGCARVGIACADSVAALDLGQACEFLGVALRPA